MSSRTLTITLLVVATSAVTLPGSQPKDYESGEEVRLYFKGAATLRVFKDFPMRFFSITTIYLLMIAIYPSSLEMEMDVIMGILETPYWRV